MQITEIIQGLTNLQNDCGKQGFSTVKAQEVCRLSIHLASHVQQLEIDIKKVRSPELTDWKQEARDVAKEVCEAACDFIAYTGNSDSRQSGGYPAQLKPSAEYARLLNAARKYRGLTDL